MGHRGGGKGGASGHSQAASATCWSPNEEGTWSKTAWSCRRGEERGAAAQVSAAAPVEDTHMGYSGLAPSPGRILRAALAKSPCSPQLHLGHLFLFPLPLLALLG